MLPLLRNCGSTGAPPPLLFSNSDARPSSSLPPPNNVKEHSKPLLRGAPAPAAAAVELLESLAEGSAPKEKPELLEREDNVLFRPEELGSPSNKEAPNRTVARLGEIDFLEASAPPNSPPAIELTEETGPLGALLSKAGSEGRGRRDAEFE
ncbi:MAG: hypothetical protein WCN87_01210 [Chlamydiota bacterium]